MVLSVQLFVYVITTIFIIFVCLFVRFSINSIHVICLYPPCSSNAWFFLALLGFLIQVMLYLYFNYFSVLQLTFQL
jgi:hypothetical protein